MLPRDLVKDLIVTGGPFNEPVQIMEIVHGDSDLRFIGTGVESRRLYTLDLSHATIALLSVPSDLNPTREYLKIVRDGRLTVPLYHGTCSLFYDSIMKFGLGGVNSIKEFRVIEHLAVLVELCDKYLPPKEEWMPKMQSARLISKQTITTAGLNFRHGAVYLSPALSAAARYGAGKEFGSEAIQYFMDLYRRLSSERPDLRESISREAAPLLEFVSKPSVPLVIEVKGADVSGLRDEAGGDVAKRLALLEDFFNRKNKNIFAVISQQLNFEATRPIPVNQLTVYRVADHYEYAMEEPPLVPFNT